MNHNSRIVKARVEKDIENRAKTRFTWRCTETERHLLSLVAAKEKKTESQVISEALMAFIEGNEERSRVFLFK